MFSGKSLEEVKAIVSGYKRSGLIKKVYCKKFGITASQMDDYIRYLKSNNIVIRKEVPKRKFTHFKLSDNFIRDTSIVLKYKELEIELKESFNQEQLKRVLDTIGFSSNV